MTKIFSFIVLVLLPFLTPAQSSKAKAVKNFEDFFTSFKNAYPADHNKDTIKDYSELQPLSEIPEELKMMIEYDTSKFYTLYLDHIKYLRDTLINISSLNLSQEIKDIYAIFRQSIINGEQQDKFNYKQDRLYSEELKSAIKNLDPPQTGYIQNATMVQSSGGPVKESKILIRYNNDLEVISFGLAAK